MQIKINWLLQARLNILTLGVSPCGAQADISLRLEHIQSGGKFGSSAYFSFLFTVFRVFTVGIGSGVSSSLINGVARAGNGKAEFIMGKDRIQPKVNYKYKLR